VTKTTPVPVATTIDLSKQTVGLERETGNAVLMPPRNGGPPTRIPGYTVSVWFAAGDSPHAGELHPDADELLYSVSGRIEIILELEDGERRVEIGPGDAAIVPRGTWHRIEMKQPGQILNITPGPNADWRPLPRTR